MSTQPWAWMGKMYPAAEIWRPRLNVVKLFKHRRGLFTYLSDDWYDLWQYQVRLAFDEVVDSAVKTCQGYNSPKIQIIRIWQAEKERRPNDRFKSITFSCPAKWLDRACTTTTNHDTTMTLDQRN